MSPVDLRGYHIVFGAVGEDIATSGLLNELNIKFILEEFEKFKVFTTLGNLDASSFVNSNIWMLLRKLRCSPQIRNGISSLKNSSSLTI